MLILVKSLISIRKSISNPWKNLTLLRRRDLTLMFRKNSVIIAPKITKACNNQRNNWNDKRTLHCLITVTGRGGIVRTDLNSNFSKVIFTLLTFYCSHWQQQRSLWIKSSRSLIFYLLLLNSFSFICMCILTVNVIFLLYSN